MDPHATTIVVYLFCVFVSMVHFLLFVLVVSTSASDCMERLVPEMTYSLTHSLTHSQPIKKSPKVPQCHTTPFSATVAM